MWKEFSYRGTYKWIDILDDLIDEYNNTKHRTIKMKPDDVNVSNEQAVLATVCDLPYPNIPRAKFKSGDFVRMSKYKHVFAKGYTPNWTTEIFRINKVQPTNPITYLLIDLEGQNINGTFYTEELQLAKNPNLYLVEKIIKEKNNQVYVKWLGFDSKHNSWVDKKDVL